MIGANRYAAGHGVIEALAEGLALDPEGASRAPGWGTLAGVLAVAAVVYAASCWWWPFAKCPKCKGLGRVFRKDGKVFRFCPRCAGTGRRLRIGRRLYNIVHRRRREAS